MESCDNEIVIAIEPSESVQVVQLDPAEEITSICDMDTVEFLAIIEPNPDMGSACCNSGEAVDLTGYATESYVNQQLEAYNVFANYKTQNVDEDGLLTYVGKQKPTGEWLIERHTASGDDILVQYANLSNNVGYTYSTAWTARAGLTYNFINVLTGL